MKVALNEITNLDSVGLSELALVGYEEILLNLAAVIAFPNLANRFEAPTPSCGPAIIRRARDYIKEHASEIIEISKIAAELGLSMRAMQENFQRHFGFSPRAYVLDCRLELVRERLLAATDGMTVTEIALECGFSDLGHFSAKYYDKFGELPSITLRLARI